MWAGGRLRGGRVAGRAVRAALAKQDAPDAAPHRPRRTRAKGGRAASFRRRLCSAEDVGKASPFRSLCGGDLPALVALSTWQSRPVGDCHAVAERNTGSLLQVHDR
jgi:hypothetical protein